jgi:hypothetical protein
MLPRQIRKIERELIRTRNRLERKGQRMALDMLHSLVPERITSIENVEAQISAIKPDNVREFFKSYYGLVGGTIGLQEYKRFVRSKAELVDEYLYTTFYEEMVTYCLQECGSRITGIVETTKDLLRAAAKQAVSEANVNGWGIEKTKDYILELMKDTVKPSRARAIAQTEIITASNKASYEAAVKTGLNFKKYWSTSGLPKIRETHLYAESFSVERGGIRMDERFEMGDGTTMLHPGDPAGGAGNVINCRCTLIQIPT